jgi:hypothetical protein
VVAGKLMQALNAPGPAPFKWLLLGYMNVDSET